MFLRVKNTLYKNFLQVNVEEDLNFHLAQDALKYSQNYIFGEFYGKKVHDYLYFKLFDKKTHDFSIPGEWSPSQFRKV